MCKSFRHFKWSLSSQQNGFHTHTFSTSSHVTPNTDVFLQSQRRTPTYLTNQTALPRSHDSSSLKTQGRHASRLFSLYWTIHWCMRSSVTGCLQRPTSFLNTRTLLQASSKSTQLKKNKKQHAHLWPVILFSYFYWSNSPTNSSGKEFYHNGSRL